MVDKVEDININQILGYGEILNILVGAYAADEGVHKKGEPKIERYHITPVSIKENNKLITAVNKFFEHADSITDIKSPNDEAYQYGIEIIFLSTRKMHPDLTKEQIGEKFGLLGIAKATKIAMELNNFLAEVKGMVKQAEDLDMESKTLIMKK